MIGGIGRNIAQLMLPVHHGRSDGGLRLGTRRYDELIRRTFAANAVCGWDPARRIPKLVAGRTRLFLCQLFVSTTPLICFPQVSEISAHLKRPASADGGYFRGNLCLIDRESFADVTELADAHGSRPHWQLV